MNIHLLMTGGQMAGRPRGIEDAVILRAAADLIGQLGLARLTLAGVAQQVGLVPGTLVQRFGSKRGLLLALAGQAAQDADTLLGQVRAGHVSALAALEALLLAPWDAATTPETYANHLAFLCVDLTDPQFHPHAVAVHEAQGRAITAELTRAVAAGELRAAAGAATLASSVQAVAAGAGLMWALDRVGTLPERIRHELSSVLAPYLPPGQEES
jgi:AcrR family transcriptional regulator